MPEKGNRDERHTIELGDRAFLSPIFINDVFINSTYFIANPERTDFTWSISCWEAFAAGT